MFLGNRLGTGRVRPFGGFVPSDIANLELHLDASNAVSLGSPSADDPISSWLDLTANDNDMSQATGVSQPLYKASGFGTESKPYLLFDGSNDFLTFSTDVDSTQYTSFVVTQQDGAISVGLSKAVSAREQSHARVGTVMYVRTKDSFQSVTYTNANTVVFRTVAQTGQKVLLYGNSASISLGDFSSDAGVDSDFGTLGLADTSYHGGKIAEVLMYNAILTAGECASVETYLNAKYGIY